MFLRTQASDKLRTSNIESSKMRGLSSTNQVVNLEFCTSCLNETQREWKATLEEVHTYAKLKTAPKNDLPSLFTLCINVMTTYGSKQTLFTLAGKDGNRWLAAQMQVDDNMTRFMHWDWAQVKLPHVFAYQWVSSCMAVNSETGLLQWVVDGTLVENVIVDQVKDRKNMPTDISGKIVLGAWQWSGSKKWQARTTNQVSKLNIFSTALTISDMQEITLGRNCSREGDYLAWKDMKWDLKGEASIDLVNEIEVCGEQHTLNIYPAPFTSMQSCMRLCQNLGSKSPSLVTKDKWSDLQSALDAIGWPKDERLWLALDDAKAEGEWANFYDGSLVNFSLPWAAAEPNGGRGENCVALQRTIGMLDYPCNTANWPHACMCERTSVPYLRLRGLCSSSNIQDTLFQPMNNLTDFTRLTLVGLKTVIKFDKAEQTWVLRDEDLNVTGVSTASHESFTLGKHNWTIRGDKGCSRGGQEYTIQLKMSGCLEGTFTCNDGQCVSIEKRCDQLLDCRDESDEENCNILELKKGYHKKIPPGSPEDPLNVTVSVDLLRLVDINEEDYSIDIQFEISLMWKDERVRFHNLKQRETLNALTEEDVEKLWLPKVIFENTEQKESTRLGERGNGEWETRFIVRRERNAEISRGFTYLDETEIFKGSDNSLIMNQTYTHNFFCNYELSHYPFDTQV